MRGRADCRKEHEMNQWSNSARKKLEDYFARVRATIQASGADVNEVIDDLRRHGDEEIARRNVVVVTEQDVGQILARIGAPEAPTVMAAPELPKPRLESTLEKLRKGLPGWALLVFAVVIPLGTIGFEFFTGACAGIFF